MRLFPSAVIVLLVDGDAVPETSNRFGDLGRQWIVLVSRRNSLQCRKMSDVSRTSCRACNVRLQPAFPIRTGYRISHARCRHDDAEARRDEKSSRWTYAPARPFADDDRSFLRLQIVTRMPRQLKMSSRRKGCKPA